MVGPVAQRLEQGTHNPLAGGSNPSGPTQSKPGKTTKKPSKTKGNDEEGDTLPRDSTCFAWPSNGRAPKLNITDEQAFYLLVCHYSHRCQPPCSLNERRHKVEKEAKNLLGKPLGGKRTRQQTVDAWWQQAIADIRSGANAREVITYCKAMSTRRGLESFIALATSEIGVTVSHDDLDNDPMLNDPMLNDPMLNDPMLVGFDSGVLGLRTGS